MQRVDRIDVSPLLERPGVARIMELARSRGATARFVGGCVRDLLLHRPIGDIDLAIDIVPEQTREMLRDGGFATLDYGLSHGTVAAATQRTVVEITSLRVDVRALGRHAEVAFTDNWQADAERRDFTLNAIYADPDGALYDPCSGRSDLQAGRIRFVGDAAARIAEDRLRILRFFRFQAWFGTQPADASALEACAAAADELRNLSGERICAEMLKLLSAPSPESVLGLMAQADVLAEVVPDADLARLAVAIAAERALSRRPDPLLRLAALLRGRAEVETVANRWKLSRKQADRLFAAAAPEAGVQGALTAGDARLLLYRAGRQAAADLATLSGDADLATAIGGLRAPEFPLRGADALAIGMPSGASVGALLKELEAWWIEGNFCAGRSELLDELRRRAKN